MRYPVGPAFQHLRSLSLTAIPSDVKANCNNPWTLSDWRHSGNYTITSCATNGFTLECSSVDLGNCFLSEAEFLLDHVAEHRVTVWRDISSSGWVSPAWLTVTVYYWAFFSALAISRLIGSALHYLTRDNLRIFKSLITGACNAGGGAYEFIFEKELSITKSQYSLKHSRNSNYHEAVWKHLAKVLFDTYRNYADEQNNSLEYRLFSCISDNPEQSQSTWPTALRNAVNYRPGLAYREVRKHRDIDLCSYIKETKMMTFNDVVDAYEITKRGLGTLNVMTNRSEYCRLLVLKAVLLTSLAEALHNDVRSRRGIDERWGKMRTLFYSRNRSESLVEKLILL
jgi:hypothetical protein